MAKRNYKKGEIKTSRKGYQNKRMNENVYHERRIVMDLIYEARDLCRKSNVDFPRINVRIMEKDPKCEDNFIGFGSMDNSLYIWILDKCVQLNSENYLRQLVFHELLHAVKNCPHIVGSKLMSGSMYSEHSYPKEELQRDFIKYMKMSTL